ncbi:unnamed protein product [Moneuplotes crassus]|uniref:Uncharacterized protein n=1 Tax=Euplotes crassus TaxID=5936 RepID=A0AAD1UII1_EUPCR|nr:unnamed protein product [Moneuplotes crassus]
MTLNCLGFRKQIEKLPECHAEECTNVATYLHKGFNVNICDEHYQLNHKESCVKLENIDERDGIKEALEVIQACTKNLQVVLDSDNDKEDQEEIKHLLAEVLTQTQEMFIEIEKGEEGEGFQDNHEIKNKVRDIFLQLKSEEGFKQFCVVNYTHLVCDYLSLNKVKINEILKIEGFDKISNLERNMVHENTNLLAYKELQNKFCDFKKKAIALINPSTLEQLEKCYEMITGVSEPIKASSGLVLKFDNIKDLDFINSMENMPICDLDSLKIRHIRDNLQVAKDFIYLSFPRNVREFHFNSEGKIYDFENIIDTVSFVSPLVSTGLFLYNFKLNQAQMKKLFRIVSKRLIYVGVPQCILELDSIPDFSNSLDGSIIEWLGISYCGSPECCDWKKYPERFSNLIRGLVISKDFKTNLKEITINESGLSLEIVQQTLKENGLGHVKIYRHSM